MQKEFQKQMHYFFPEHGVQVISCQQRHSRLNTLPNQQSLVQLQMECNYCAVT